MAVQDNIQTMVDHHVKNIPAGTDKEQVEAVFAAYGGKVTFLKAHKRVKYPYAFVDVPADNVAKMMMTKLTIGENTLEINTAYKSIKYFLDCRQTSGSLSKVSAENLETYFSTFGEVIEAKKVDEKGFGFLVMKCSKDESNKEAELLATTSPHTIDGQEIAVSLSKETSSIKYFLDSRETEGNLDEVTQEQLEAYFSTFGQVVDVRKMEGKQFGFLAMKKEEGNTEVETLAFNLHTIAEQEINVSEQKNNRRGRNRNTKRKRNRRNSMKFRNRRGGKKKTKTANATTEPQTLDQVIKSE